MSYPYSSLLLLICILPLAALRVEYFKARARKERYREEIIFVEEEKRRTLVTLDKQALLWDQREGQVRSIKDCPTIAEGAAAYAARRAAEERALRAKFQVLWASGVVVQPGTPASTSPAETVDPVDVDDGAEGVVDGEELIFTTGAGDSDVEDLAVEDSDDEE